MTILFSEIQINNLSLALFYLFIFFTVRTQTFMRFTSGNNYTGNTASSKSQNYLQYYIISHDSMQVKESESVSGSVMSDSL